MTRLWSGRNLPLVVQKKGSGGEQGSSDGEEGVQEVVSILRRD